MKALNYEYGVGLERKIAEKLFPADVIQKNESAGKKEVIIRHEKGGIMFFLYLIFLAIIFWALRDSGSTEDYLAAGGLLLIFFCRR